MPTADDFIKATGLSHEFIFNGLKYTVSNITFVHYQFGDADQPDRHTGYVPKKVNLSLDLTCVPAEEK